MRCTAQSTAWWLPLYLPPGMARAWCHMAQSCDTWAHATASLLWRLLQAAPHQNCLCPVGEGEYSLRFSELGTRVAIVSSEPITRRSSDWVAVPRNTALIISQEKGGQLNILKAPIAAHGK